MAYIICAAIIIQIASAQTILNIPSNGETATIFQLFDAKTGTFRSFNLTSPLSYQYITIQPEGESLIKETIIRNSFDELSAGEYGAQFQLDVVLGLFGSGKVSGGGSFSSIKKTSAKKTIGRIKIQEGTFKKSVHICRDEILPHIKKSLINSKVNATHVVIAIQYGLNLEISFESTNADNDNVEVAEAHLEAAMKSTLLSANAKLEANSTSSKKNSSQNYNIQVKCNIPLSFDFPRDYESVTPFLQRLPELAKSSSYNSGIISYTVLELQEVFQCQSLQYEADVLFRMTEQNLVFIKNTILNLEKAQQNVNDICDEIFRFRSCMPAYVVTRLERKKQSFDLKMIEFKSTLGNKIQLAKFGQDNETNILQYIHLYLNSEYSGQNMLDVIQLEYTVWIYKSHVYSMLARQGIECMPVRQNLGLLFLLNPDFQFVILLFDSQDFFKNSVNFQKSTRVFTTHCTHCQNCKCLIADCTSDFEMCQNFEMAEVRTYFKGVYEVLQLNKLVDILQTRINQEDLRQLQFVNATVYLYKISYVLKNLLRNLEVRTQDYVDEIREFVKLEHKITFKHRVGSWIPFTNVSLYYDDDIIRFAGQNATALNPVEQLYEGHINFV